MRWYKTFQFIQARAPASGRISGLHPGPGLTFRSSGVHVQVRAKLSHTRSRYLKENSTLKHMKHVYIEMFAVGLVFLVLIWLSTVNPRLSRGTRSRAFRERWKSTIHRRHI